MQIDTRSSLVDQLYPLIRKETERCECIDALGGETDKEITANARALVNVASYDDIVSWIRKIESIKGKSYDQVNKMVPNCGIPGTFLGAKVSPEELVIWYDQVIKTTFANGTRYQPLPSHDEAWKTLSTVRNLLVCKKRHAELWLYTYKDMVPMAPEKLMQAAELGLWDDLPIRAKRTLFRLLPQKEKTRIKKENRGTTCAMQETRNYYDKTYQRA
ncbi:MAG: hypothetical protein HGA70_05735 [Chlorobiaceae bacterium]|nr:hypothetical protein [Chlorobiaceae bacterium]